ncbi:MAG: protein kinase [Myxococcales bacterium]|nr:protein kinase [Myxococcales bacterium]
MSVVWYCPLCQSEGYDAGTVFCSNDGARVRPIAERGIEWIGKVLADRYKVVRFIDAGGTAEVYEAERTSNGRRVAMKLLHAAHAERPEATDDFLREAQLVSRIGHPNIVAIEDFGTLPSGVHYMVMELLDGAPLSVELARGPLQVMQALKWAMQACEGLAAAHARDVLHCDIKPANIFLQRVPTEAEPVVKILDLGIGRLFAGGTTERVASGMIAGTPEYMSPEQALGHPLTAASDIYSMGVAVYEMLLGVVPFSDESYVQVLEKHVHQKPTWPSKLADERGVPPEAAAVVMKSLEKDPAARPGSMLDLQRELAAITRQVRARNNAPTQQRLKTATAPTPSPERPSPSAPLVTPPASAPISQSARKVASAPPRASVPPRSAPKRPVETVPLATATGADHEVVELAKDTYWVGRRRGQQLECNAYLRIFKQGPSEVSILFDPGPPEDYEILSAKVAHVLGTAHRLDYVFLNHQDPDVASNAASLQQASRHTRVICSEDTFRLARFYGLDPRRFSAIESFHGGVFALPTGHSIQFVPTPFCHFRGAVMVYDPETRILFSGDLFGGARSSDMIASDRSWPGVEMFHQIYMPSRKALELACGRVRRLTPAPALIAPQHGAMIVGQDTVAMVDSVAELEVGLDMLEASSREERFVEAANDIRREYVELAGDQRARDLVASFADDASFTRLLLVDGEGEIVGFKVAPRLALEALANDALATLPAERRGDLRRSIQVVWKQRELDQTSSGFPSMRMAIDRSSQKPRG